MGRWIALIGLMSLLGCGPELTNRQAEENEKNTIIDQQKAALESFEGDFPGFIRDRTGRKLSSILHLRGFVTIATLASRYEKLYIPNLVGSLVVKTSDQTNIWYSFDQGVFDPRDGTLRLLGSNRDRTFAFIVLNPQGNKLSGSIIVGPLVQEVEFNRSSSKK